MAATSQMHSYIITATDKGGLLQTLLSVSLFITEYLSFNKHHAENVHNRCVSNYQNFRDVSYHYLCHLQSGW